MLEAAFYHAGHCGIETGCFLPGADGSTEIERALNSSELDFRTKLLSCFPTQRETLQQFAITSERFRIAPKYDFTRPPHEGKLFYENFPWGITSAEFCALAGRATASRAYLEHFP